MSFVNMRPRFASMAPFLCLMLCHLEWPDIDYSLICAQFRLQFSTAWRGKMGGAHLNSGNSGVRPLCLFVAISSLLGVVSTSDRALGLFGHRCPLPPSSSLHPRRHQRSASHRPEISCSCHT